VLRWGEAVSPHQRKDAEKGAPAFRCCHSLDPVVHLNLLQVWINQGDIVLLSLREFQDDKADVIVKYTADEARSRKPPRLACLLFLIRNVFLSESLQRAPRKRQD